MTFSDSLKITASLDYSTTTSVLPLRLQHHKTTVSPKFSQVTPLRLQHHQITTSQPPVLALRLQHHRFKASDLDTAYIYSTMSAPRLPYNQCWKVTKHGHNAPSLIRYQESNSILLLAFSNTSPSVQISPQASNLCRNPAKSHITPVLPHALHQLWFDLMMELHFLVPQQLKSYGVVCIGISE